MKPTLRPHPLVLALGVLLINTPAWADDSTDLGTLQVTTQSRLKNTDTATLVDMNKRTETDLRGILNEDPAVEFGGGRATSQWTTIRGVAQNQIDIKVDDTYGDTRLFRYQGRFLPDPAMIKIVSIKKGTGSASAGIGATHGAIIARSLDAKDLLKDTDRPYGVKLHAGYASNKGHSYGASVFGALGNLDGLVALNVVDEDNYTGGKGYQNVDGKKQVQHSAIAQKSVLAKVGMDINDNHRLTLSHRTETHKGVRALREQYDMSTTRLTASTLAPAQQAMGYTLTDEFAGLNHRVSPPARTFYVKDAQGNYVSGDEGNRIANRTNSESTTNLHWQGQQLGFVSDANANVYRSIAKRDSTPEDLAGIPLVSGARIDTTGANLNLNSEVGDDYLLKYGINYRHQTATPQQLAEGFQAQEKTDAGAYVEGIATLGDWTLTTGVRYDYFKIHKAMSKNAPTPSHAQLNPSLGVIYSPTQALSLRGNVSVASRSPRLYEPSIAGGLSRNVINFAPNIKPETALTRELGFDYKKDNFQASGSYFWQTTKDIHGYQGESRSVSNTANVGTLKNQGYELSAAYTLDKFTAKAAVAHSLPSLYGNLADDATLYAMRVGRTWTGSLGYQLSPKLEVGWRGRKVEDAFTPANLGGGTSLSGVQRNGYQLHDIYANYKPYGNDKMNINFAINNVGDTNYKPHSQSGTATTLVGAGRDIRLGVNFVY